MRLALATFMVATACGGGSGGGSVFGTGPITDAQAEEVCTADCQHDIDCGSTQDLATCVTDCKQEMVGWARADAVDTIFDCQIANACDAGDDECLDLVQPLAIHNQWETECRANLGECAPTPEDLDGICSATSTGDGDAGFIRFIAPPVIEEMLDCLPLPACDARLDCLQGVFQSHNIDF